MGSLRGVPSDGSVQHFANGLAVADGHLVLASTIDELIRVGAINYPHRLPQLAPVDFTEDHSGRRAPHPGSWTISFIKRFT